MIDNVVAWPSSDGQHMLSQRYVLTNTGGRFAGAVSKKPIDQPLPPDAIQAQSRAEPQKSKTHLAVEWLSHEAALLRQGPVALDVQQHRHQCCTGLTVEGKRVSPACTAFIQDANDASTGFCVACACGDRERARIGGDGIKLLCPTYACPRQVWGPMPGTGPLSLGARADQVRSVIRAAGAEALVALLGTSPD